MKLCFNMSWHMPDKPVFITSGPKAQPKKGIIYITKYKYTGLLQVTFRLLNDH